MRLGVAGGLDNWSALPPRPPPSLPLEQGQPPSTQPLLPLSGSHGFHAQGALPRLWEAMGGPQPPPSPAREARGLPGGLLPASQLQAPAVPPASRANPPVAAHTPQARGLELILLKLSTRGPQSPRGRRTHTPPRTSFQASLQALTCPLALLPWTLTCAQISADRQSPQDQSQLTEAGGSGVGQVRWNESCLQLSHQRCEPPGPRPCTVDAAQGGPRAPQFSGYDALEPSACSPPGASHLALC